ILACGSCWLDFMLRGGGDSHWRDPVSDDDVRVAGLIDSLKNLPAPPAIEDKLDIKPDETAKLDKPVDTPKRATAGTGAATKVTAAQRPMSAHDVAALSHDIDEINMAVLGVAAAGPA